MNSRRLVPSQGGQQLATVESGTGLERAKVIPLSLVALGVVFGDIGTSPLYAFKECLRYGTSLGEIYGTVSLILWSLILLVSIKYVGIVLRADNDGEGGILALLALAFPEKNRKSGINAAVVMTAFGIFGAALLYGDGVITPAISVLSAVEGLETVSPLLQKIVVPLTICILVALFSIQRFGTSAVGRLFGKVMFLWFLTIGAMGLVHVWHQPAILAALNPFLGLGYLFSHGLRSTLVLGSVFLAVTGGEALYADMGHFGRTPIQLSWNFFVFPSLALNYLGQGALVLSSPEAAANPFFRLAPPWLLGLLVVLATAATVIASQALISGAYSLTMQAVQLGYLPRIQILHTSDAESGQIYIPRVNILLAIVCVTLVCTFRSSSALASAYGVAVTLTMLTTTTLFFFVATRVWHWNFASTVALCTLFGAVEASFFASNVLKIQHGGWLPIAIGGILFYAMTTWKIGREQIRRRLQSTMQFDQFVASIDLSGLLSDELKPHCVRGTAVFLASSAVGTPIALLNNLKHNRVIHERNILLTFVTERVPYWAADGKPRLEITEINDRFFRVIAHFGFMEIPTIEKVTEAAKAQNFDLRPHKTTFFLGRETLVQAKVNTLGTLRRAIFCFMSRNAENAANFFQLPNDRIVEIGFPVEL
jgi:KUP system potassium uptake protein